jgi:hypothetical protein
MKMIEELENILKNNLYFLRGSRIYQTNHENSDWDFYVIGDLNDNQKIKINSLPNCNFEFFTKEEFQNEINNHEISALECLWTKENNFLFNLDLKILRKSIAQKASNSYVKAKKKLIDNEIEIAQKSLFHSFRILDFGTQIATNGKIQNYSSMNFILNEIKNLEPNWNLWEEKFKKLHNQLHSEFKRKAPK